MKKLCLLLLIVPLVFAFAGTGDPIDKIAGLIRRANAHELALNCTPTVQLTIMDEESNCPGPQAEAILAKFFKEHPPKSVRVLHRISSNSSYHFAVIVLNTDDGVYRTSFSLKSIDGRFLLNELRIEPEKTK